MISTLRQKNNRQITIWLGTISLIFVLFLAFSGYPSFWLKRLTSGLAMIRPTEGLDLTSLGTLGLLALGLVYGLKHATEVDHIVAVSTIVSQHRKLSHAALVGALWGVGHSASLIMVGTIVLVFRTAISDQLAGWLEFAVAFMIIGLGSSALFKALFARSAIHIHTHAHDGVSHVHLHFHEQGSTHEGMVVPHSHVVSRIGLKPTLVGMMHGLAGSAALTLLVLTQIRSFGLGLLYLAIFGMGSIVGMMMMSGLVGLPFTLSSKRLTGFHYALQLAAGAFSITFGLWYAYAIGVANGLRITFNGF